MEDHDVLIQKETGKFIIKDFEEMKHEELKQKLRIKNQLKQNDSDSSSDDETQDTGKLR